MLPFLILIVYNKYQEVIHLERFPERLRKLREEEGLSMGELSREIGSISQSTLSNYESGKREPKLENIIELSRYFNCSTDYLTGESDIKNQEELIKLYHLEGKNLDETMEALKMYRESDLTFEQVKEFFEILNKVRDL